ncbi:MAG: Lrp/AsnC family transcriptional regulator [Syntrophales bacterium]|nr:Lrp/AsnC family transcriptional regulator [Syntrophales bacterium]
MEGRSLKLDGIDIKLLNMLQDGLPLDLCPFDEFGRVLNIPGAEVIARIKRMLEDGIIKRTGAIFDPKQLNFVSTLCALHVSESEVLQIAAIINEYPNVTHNYLRKGEPNLWFTVIAPSEKELSRILDEIREKTGKSEIFNFRAVETYKIEACFEFKDETE